MRIYSAAFLIALSLGFGVASCAKAPPNLTPQAVIAFHSTQVIKALDVVMETAHAAHGTTPPLISAQTDLKIIAWHQQAIVIARDAPSGWRQLVTDGLVTLKANLSPQDWQVIAPYVALAQTLLKEIN